LAGFSLADNRIGDDSTDRRLPKLINRGTSHSDLYRPDRILDKYGLRDHDAMHFNASHARQATLPAHNSQIESATDDASLTRRSSI
jgi:hypothetical protein